MIVIVAHKKHPNAQEIVKDVTRIEVFDGMICLARGEENSSDYDDEYFRIKTVKLEE